MRLTVFVSLVIGSVLLFVAMPVFSHHSFMSEFDLNKPVTLGGTVTKFVWMNPHALFNMDVMDKKNGKVTNWTLETACPNALLGHGWNRNSVKPGDRIRVEGYLAKNGTPLAATKRVTLASGQTLMADSDGVRP